MVYSSYTLAVIEVQCVEYGPVLFGRIRSGTEMKDELDLFLVGFEPSRKFGPVHALGTNPPSMIARLVGPVAEVVHQDEIAESFLVEAGRQGTPNEPGGTCDGNHGAKVNSHPAT